ncbi:hypothetical protein HIM_07933 [Hirsutella minnesotensis 3608]|uniref:Peptidase S1 domain-containing protein n=1 Tax=Hirsutella minnesotensis 3608 TaxID=1043627 RepID=A0A0F7ZHJ3_9HYPO|nr:hypothetical protein HIM_07933 [Hirsutella minnesotensis 3608]
MFLKLGRTLALALLVDGTAAAAVDRRIVGGNAANPGDFPFVVYIDLNKTPWCAGTLLDGSTVLTGLPLRLTTA